MTQNLPLHHVSCLRCSFRAQDPGSPPSLACGLSGLEGEHREAGPGVALLPVLGSKRSPQLPPSPVACLASAPGVRSLRGASDYH